LEGIVVTKPEEFCLVVIMLNKASEGRVFFISSRSTQVTCLSGTVASEIGNGSSLAQQRKQAMLELLNQMDLTKPIEQLYDENNSNGQPNLLTEFHPRREREVVTLLVSAKRMLRICERKD
jgi:hypothetical protein